MIYLIKWKCAGGYVRAKMFSGNERGNLGLSGELCFRDGPDWNLFTQALKSTDEATVIFEEDE